MILEQNIFAGLYSFRILVSAMHLWHYERSYPYSPRFAKDTHTPGKTPGPSCSKHCLLK